MYIHLIKNIYINIHHKIQPKSKSTFIKKITVFICYIQKILSRALEVFTSYKTKIKANVTFSIKNFLYLIKN